MFTHAATILVALVITFAVARMLKVGVELSIILAAIVGAIIDQKNIPVRHLVEGTFTYFDVCLIFITATFFINLIKEAGGIAFIVRSILKTFYNQRIICLLLLTLILLLPGALTGSGAAAVLTVGSLVGTVLSSMGVNKTKTTAIIFLCAVMGAAAPPINLWAMMAAAGSNMPYVGFMLPLFILSVSGALFSMFYLGGKGTKLELNAIMAQLPKPPQKMSWMRVILPFATFFILVVASRLWPFHMPVLGLPLMFVIASIVAVATSPVKIPVFDILANTIRSLVPLVGIMIAVGILIQIMALSGARGLMSLGVVSLPIWVLFSTLLFILPISEGLLQYAAAPLLGVPLILLFNMKGINPIIALSAMAVMWPIGDCLPPTAVVGRAAILENKFEGSYYKDFMKACLVPMAFILLMCTLFLVFSNKLSFLIAG